MRLITATPAGHEREIEIAVLTKREAKLLRLLCQAWSNKEIAAELRIAPGTVASYIGRLRRGLRLQTRRELLLWGLQNPSALATRGAPPGLHKPGCRCNSIYCTAMRLGVSAKQPAA